MLLWTIQEESVYNSILTDGFYRCDISKSPLGQDLKEGYDWLIEQMKSRIGDPPDGVVYPVWAWYQWEGKRKKPDLRRERWSCGNKGDRFACREIDIPDEEVLLSDFDAWSIILLHGLISSSEEEDRVLEERYEALSTKEQRLFKSNNWERIFDLTPLENEWTIRADSIQATFWELRKEQIMDVRFFTAA